MCRGGWPVLQGVGLAKLGCTFGGPREDLLNNGAHTLGARSFARTNPVEVGTADMHLEVSQRGTATEGGAFSEELVVREVTGGTGLPGQGALSRRCPVAAVAGVLLEGDCSTVSTVSPKGFICPGWFISTPANTHNQEYALNNSHFCLAFLETHLLLVLSPPQAQQTERNKNQRNANRPT